MATRKRTVKFLTAVAGGTSGMFLALASGFEVLFQDVDLVWLKGEWDPVYVCVLCVVMCRR